jgi:3-oxocholest-4-en-26-oate---CoA ligase
VRPSGGAPRARWVGGVDENISTVWEHVADAVPAAVAMVQGARRLTWAELDERAARLASALAKRGVRQGSRVAIDLYNCIEYLETVYAAFKLRAVPINVNYRYQEAELVYLLDDAEAEVVVFHGSLADRLVAAAPRLRRPVLLVEVPDGAPLVPQAEEYEAFLEGADPAPRIERSGDDRLILYTGGTTGYPKGVVWRHEDLLGPPIAVNGWLAFGLAIPDSAAAAAELAAKVVAERREPRSLPAAPLMHTTALLKSFATLLLGGCVIFATSRSLDADELCRLIGDERVVDLSIVGDAFARPILASLERAKATGRPYDLSSLRRIASAGVAWSPEVKAGIAHFAPQVTFTDIIASTEGGPYALAITRPGEDPLSTRPRLTPNGRILDEDDHDVVPGSGRQGVLAASGSMPVGYLHDPQRSASTWRVVDGVRHVISGDMATIDADGNVTLLGRGSEVVNTGGEKVFVEEVEQVILTHPAVADAVVVGVPDDRFGHRVVALVSLRKGRELTERAVIDHVGAVLADHKRPRRVIFVDEVHRSPSGKADRTWAKAAAGLWGPS